LCTTSQSSQIGKLVIGFLASLAYHKFPVPQLANLLIYLTSQRLCCKSQNGLSVAAGNTDHPPPVQSQVQSNAGEQTNTGSGMDVNPPTGTVTRIFNYP